MGLQCPTCPRCDPVPRSSEKRLFVDEVCMRVDLSKSLSTPVAVREMLFLRLGQRATEVRIEQVWVGCHNRRYQLVREVAVALVAMVVACTAVTRHVGRQHGCQSWTASARSGACIRCRWVGS